MLENVRYHQNPSLTQLRSLTARSPLRGVANDYDMFVWDAGAATHADMQEIYRLTGVDLYIMPEGRQAEATEWRIDPHADGGGIRLYWTSHKSNLHGTFKVNPNVVPPLWRLLDCMKRR